MKPFLPASEWHSLNEHLLQDPLNLSNPLLPAPHPISVRDLCWLTVTSVWPASLTQAASTGRMTTPMLWDHLPHSAVFLGPQKETTVPPAPQHSRTRFQGATLAGLLLQPHLQTSLNFPTRMMCQWTVGEAATSRLVLLHGVAGVQRSGCHMHIDRLNWPPTKSAEAITRPHHRILSIRTFACLACCLLQTWSLFSIKCQVQWSLLIQKGQAFLPLKTSC